MNSVNYDLAIVGLGAVGACALYRAAKLGVRVIGIDRFNPPHDRGSHHGESRITRQAIGEGEAYVPLVLRSNAIWEQLETATGRRLLERCGFTFITRNDEATSHHGKAGFLERTRAAAERFDIAHEVLDGDALKARFPQFVGLRGDERVYFEPGGGFVRPEECIAAALSEAKRLGATVVTDRPVEAIHENGAGCEIHFQKGVIGAAHAIIATGAAITDLADERFRAAVDVHRQLLHWFVVRQPELYAPVSPTFIWTHGDRTRDQFYGFPPIDGLVKVAREDYGGGGADGAIDPAEGEEMARLHVQGNLGGLSPLPVRSANCHYAVTPDSDFLIDGFGPCTAVSACSGHGFKHAAAVGEAAVDRAVGEAPRVDLEPFRARQFST